MWHANVTSLSFVFCVIEDLLGYWTAGTKRQAPEKVGEPTLLC